MFFYVLYGGGAGKRAFNSSVRCAQLLAHVWDTAITDFDKCIRMRKRWLEETMQKLHETVAQIAQEMSQGEAAGGESLKKDIDDIKALIAKREDQLANLEATQSLLQKLDYTQIDLFDKTANKSLQLSKSPNMYANEVIRSKSVLTITRNPLPGMPPAPVTTTAPFFTHRRSCCCGALASFFCCR